MNKGESGSTYNIGGENEWENIALLYKLIEIVSERVGLDKDSVLGTITYVEDRSGHDWRYAIDCTKMKNELDWKQSVDFEKGLSLTVDWYLSHTEWIENIKSGEYTHWLKRNYGSR
jgi:dTDP-glucose 4,6-dehydratase